MTLRAPLLLAGLACGIGCNATPPPKEAPPAATAAATVPKRAPSPPRFSATDLYAIKTVSEAAIAPDATRIAYTVQSSEGTGRPMSQIWLFDLASRTTTRVGSERGSGSNPRWAPDGGRLAYVGHEGERSGLFVMNVSDGERIFLAPVPSTNHPLPSTGHGMSWSPDGKEIAFVAATSGPEGDGAGNDPMVITRYLYKPTASEGLTRFNDNRRLHIFVANVATRLVRPLTGGAGYEHSIDWSPKGDEIVFLANPEPDPDRVFNYDIFAASVRTGAVRRLTETKSVEYQPAWAPDGWTVAYLGTRRTLTSSETTMEDTHVWTVDAKGGAGREVGGATDNRQGAVGWAPDGTRLYFTVQERGDVRLYRIPAGGGQAEAVSPPAGERGTVGSWSAGKGDAVAFSMTTPSRPAELFLKQGTAPARRLTALNDTLFQGKPVADVEALTFRSHDGKEVEAFLTVPLGRAPDSRHPMVVMMHGGPHGQQGPAFTAKAQVYAARGWAALMVNYRGSTGYGQKFADAIFKDQNGGEAKDVLAGVDAALGRYPWLDPERLGLEGVSYGGQLTNWIITRTDRFKAAIPLAGISNLVTQNYLAYYHDYLAVEFGGYPHTGRLMDLLWERSPLRYVARVKTPTLFLHGENDSDVSIAEAEQFFIALKDAGVETVMVRYPREGHGLRETKHIVDSIERSMAWYERHWK